MNQSKTKTEERRLALIFPGIGYHTDKPLLYHSKRLAGKYGYEIREISYGELPENVKGSAEKMQRSFELALERAKISIKELDLKQYDRILLIAKSLGTVVASALCQEMGLEAEMILYTPVEATFRFGGQRGIAFHGKADSWVETPIVEEGCRKRDIPLYMTEDANHSLETGDVLLDLQNLYKIMRQTDQFLRGMSAQK